MLNAKFFEIFDENALKSVISSLRVKIPHGARIRWLDEVGWKYFIFYIPNN